MCVYEVVQGRSCAMSYPMQLDEYSEVELRKELRRRELAYICNACDYCGNKRFSTPVCRFPDRHGVINGRESFETEVE